MQEEPGRPKGIAMQSEPCRSSMPEEPEGARCFDHCVCMLDSIELARQIGSRDLHGADKRNHAMQLKYSKSHKEG